MRSKLIRHTLGGWNILDANIIRLDTSQKIIYPLAIHTKLVFISARGNFNAGLPTASLDSHHWQLVPSAESSREKHLPRVRSIHDEFDCSLLVRWKRFHIHTSPAKSLRCFQITDQSTLCRLQSLFRFQGIQNFLIGQSLPEVETAFQKS
jgi:hypothetical protein